VRVAFIVLSAVLAAIFLGAAPPKLLRQQRMADAARHLGYSVAAIQAIGVLEVAATIGLVIGVLFWAPLGVAAAIGLLALLIGAVLAHRRVGDGAEAIRLPASLAVLAAATAASGVLTL
jgi:DoxX-like family